jgi:type IV pilus assembly protein PilC
MAVFQYTATDQAGASSQGNFEAENEEQARSQLAQYGLTVSALVPVDSGESPSKAAAPEKKKKKGLMAFQIGGGPSSEDISVFTRQMSTLVQAGLPLLRSLEVMIKQQEKKPKFKAMLEDISEKVSSGGNLSDGLALYPKTFDNLFVNMVKAGEAGGVLELVLDRLAQFQEKSIRTIKKSKVGYDLSGRHYVRGRRDRDTLDDGGGSPIPIDFPIDAPRSASSRSDPDHH